MLKAKARLLKSAAVAEFYDISVFCSDLARALHDSDDGNLEQVGDDIDVVVARLKAFKVDFSEILAV